MVNRKGTINIVAFGDVVIDFTPFKEKGTYIQNFGGAPANVCLAATRTGSSAAFCGMVGQDLFGHFLLKTLLEQGINTEGVCVTDKAVTTMTFVQLSEDGERDFVFVRKPGADMLFAPEHVNRQLIEKADIFHFCMLALKDNKKALYEMLDIAGDGGALISFDVNYRQNVWEHQFKALMAIEPVLPSVDLLKMSEDEAFMISAQRTLKDALVYFSQQDRLITVITCGQKGAYCIHRGEIVYESGYNVQAIDTTGAGDAFWGTFLSGIKDDVQKENVVFSREKLHWLLKRSNAAGALAVQKKGVIDAIARSEEIEKFLADQEK